MTRARGASMIVVLALSAIAGCERESRDFPRPAPGAEVGDKETAAAKIAHDERNAYALAEGKKLWSWYNCSGCHANGGGGSGPALMDDVWIYGGEPANIFDTIVKGRPNGMPAWGGRIPQYQIWQLVAFVRSLSGQQPKAATPARTDNIELYPNSIQNKVPGQTQ